MTLELELASILKSQGADIVAFTDISRFSREQNRGFPSAIIFGIALSPAYIRELSNNTPVKKDEFQATESKSDRLADDMADYITQQGYSAYSQSEYNLTSTDSYNEEKKATPLPHKTIAGQAGLGWIGNHNLLINSEYGSAISLCSILTDAPLKTVSYKPAYSQCGDCSICKDICQAGVISGTSWKPGTSRDEIVDVHHCTSCLMCLALCPWTTEYVMRAYK